MSNNTYEELSLERKKLQSEGRLPEWFTTGGWQMFSSTYQYQSTGYLDQIRRVAKTISKHASKFLETDHPYYKRLVENYGDSWEECFYAVLASGDLAPSSPILSNAGTNRGCSVSCSGSSIEDSIDGFFSARHETALLTKEGFGTSAYLGDIRPRGSAISKGGKAEGTLPVLLGFSKDAKDVSQAGVRRGSWAGYIEVDHDDFEEWISYLHKNPEGLNIGWIFTKKFIQRCEDGDEEAIYRFQKVLWVKMQTGKGYIWKVDHVEEQQPPCYKKHGLKSKASNLCVETSLFSDGEHTFTCILSSMNLLHFDRWKDQGAAFIAIIFLDCVAQDFIEVGEKIKGLEKAVRYTKKGRSLGLGTMGFHSYLQKNLLPFESFEAHQKNTEIFKHIADESLEASKWLAKTFGEPEWCKGFGIRSTHLTAIAPNMSSAVIAGQVSQGIEPIFANVFLQPTAAGEMQRISPLFLEVMQSRGKHTKQVINSIIDNNGSVQHLTWLTTKEKAVFKTAFEIDQRAILRLASVRQQYIDQGQSLNLFFDANEKEEYIAQIHKEALLDPRIKGLYYIRTQAGVQAAKDNCIACE